METSRERLVIDDLIGKPYGFRESGDAYDCFTIVAEVFHRLGWSYAIPVQIRERFDDGVIHPTEIDPDVWQPVPGCHQLGDVALIRGPLGEGGDGTARHCAVMISPGIMLECTEKHGVHTIPWRLLRPFTVQCVRYAGGAL